MQFYVFGWRGSLPQNAIYPCVSIESDSWNDYGYYTTFHLNYWIGSTHKAFPTDFDVKILDRDKNIATLPAQFQQLDDSYCSLGQQIEYYQALFSLDDSVYQDILTGLNDVVFNQRIAGEFEQEEGFQKSLLRFSEAEKAYKEGGLVIRKQATEKERKAFKFDFECKVRGAEDFHRVDFDFSHDRTGLFRISAIIGRNGTGKTQFLANFANAMSGWKREEGHFSPERPAFSKVVAISYSVFDEFERPSEYANT